MVLFISIRRKNPRCLFWKLQLNLQPHYPGGNFVTLNMEAEQTGWKRQRWSVGEWKRRDRPPTRPLDDALDPSLSLLLCVFARVCVCVCNALCSARTLWSVRRCCCTQIKCVFWMRGTVGGVCVCRLIIAGCLCFASACTTVCVHVCECVGICSRVWAVI